MNRFFFITAVAILCGIPASGQKLRGLASSEGDEGNEERAARLQERQLENEEDNENPPPPSDNGDPEADVHATAELLGLSLDDAKELLRQQEEFSDLVSSLEEDNLFMQAKMPSTPDGEFVIMYKNGNIPKKKEEDIEKFKAKNSNATVKKVATKRSLKDAKARGERLADKLEKKNFKSIGYSIDGDSLELVAKKTNGHDKKDKGRIPPGRAAEILDMKEDDPDAEELSLIVEEPDAEDPSGDEHTYGGRKINGPLYQCTTAFSVRSSSGVTGTLTAEHCQEMDWYDAVPPENDYSATRQGRHNGFWGDFQWLTTSHIEPAEYYYLPTSRWPVRKIASSISTGQVVCVFSRMQGQRFCDVVHRTSVAHSGSSNLVAMKYHSTTGGDSGGPWSNYDVAYGVHKGYMTICDSSFLAWEWDCSKRSTWSRVSYLGPAMGVQVITQ